MCENSLTCVILVGTPSSPANARSASESEKTRCQWTHRRPHALPLRNFSANSLINVSSSLVWRKYPTTLCTARLRVLTVTPSGRWWGWAAAAGSLAAATCCCGRHWRCSLSSICVHVFPSNVPPLYPLSPALSVGPVCLQERPMRPQSVDLRPGGWLRRRVWWNIMQWVTGGRFSSHLFNGALQAAAICATACCFF